MSARALKHVYNIEDLRQLARRRLPRAFFEFVDRGTEDEVALANNRQAFDSLQLSARVLADVSRRSLKTELFGSTHAMPIAVAPTGVAGLLWHGGEVATARAARDAGVPFCVATTSVASVEDVARLAGGTLWYQVYMWPESRFTYEMIARAKAAGCEALILTVDGVVSPNREYNQRNGYAAPFRFTGRNVLDVAMHPRWMLGTLGRYVLEGGFPAFQNYPEEVRQKVTSRQIDRRTLINNPSLCWDDVRAVRAAWPRRLLVKGIMNPQDARLAVAAGADAVIVSNHGGRNLDSAPAPIEVLPDIVAEVGQQVPVLLDSGIRRGTDVIKALALGASMVLAGRGPLYGTAAAGEPGARRALDIFRSETDRVMGLIGCNSVQELGPQHVRVRASTALRR